MADPDAVGRRLADLPGGCVITQPWRYTRRTPDIVKRVSPDTVCYCMYANPKGGTRRYVPRDGTITAWETPSIHIISLGDLAEGILAAYLYRCRPSAFCCAGADLRLTNARPVIGPPDN